MGMSLISKAAMAVPGPGGRRLALWCSALALAATAGCALDPALPVGASDHPRLTVEPSTALLEGSLVKVRGHALGSGARTVWQCVAGARNADTDCERSNWTAELGPHPDSDFVATLAVTAMVGTRDGRRVDCRARPGACVIAVAGLTPSPSGLIAGPAQVATSITFAPARPAVRYRDRVFGRVTINRNLVYVTRPATRGGALHLDLYQPQGDPAPRRPLIVWIHGGGYALGDKHDMATWARDWAQRGYVAAAIDYRLRPGVTPADPAILDAAQDAAADACASLMWLRNHRARYRIDPDAMIVAGESAGAATALEVSYHPTAAAVRPAATISVAGAIPSTVPIPATDTPALMFNGIQDTINPFARARRDCQRVRAAGATCRLVAYRGAGHGLDQLRPNIDVVMADYLVQRVLRPRGLWPSGLRRADGETQSADRSARIQW